MFPCRAKAEILGHVTCSSLRLCIPLVTSFCAFYLQKLFNLSLPLSSVSFEVWPRPLLPTEPQSWGSDGQQQLRERNRERSYRHHPSIRCPGTGSLRMAHFMHISSGLGPFNENSPTLVTIAVLLFDSKRCAFIYLPCSVP